MNSITSSAICRGRQPSGSKASSLVTITFVGSWLGRATGSKTPSSAGREPLLEPSGFCSPPHPSTRRARISNGKILIFMRCPFLLCVLFGSAERAHSTPGRRSTPRERPGFWLRAEDEILEGNQAVPGSLAHGLGAVVDLKLGVEGRDVELDGVLADVELAGYEPVGEPATKQLKNLALARGQRLGERFGGGRGFLQQPFGEGFGEYDQTLHDGGRRGSELLRRGVRRHDAPAPERQGAQPGYRLVVIGDQDERLRTVLGDGDGRLFEQLLVREEDDVGLGER